MQNLDKQIDTQFPPEYPVVFLHAHPDDESFLSAGLIQYLSKKGRDVIIVYCAAALVAHESKTQIRQKEASEALKILNVKNILYLNYCEPQYNSENPTPLSKADPKNAALAVINCLQNEGVEKCIIVSYDKNGGYGNADHKIVHQVGRELFQNHFIYFNRLFEVTINFDKIQRWLDENKSMPVNYLPELKYWSKEFGSSDKEISLGYELDNSSLENKFRALKSHQSQLKIDLFPLSLKNSDFSYLFGVEYLIEIEPKFFSAVERKFLITDFPKALSVHNQEIIQGYLPNSTINNQKRIRKVGETYTYTESKGVGLDKVSRDCVIDKTLFERLWDNTKGRRIEKVRYKVKYQDLMIDVDVFHGDKKGLIIAELEVRDLTDNNLPSWIKKEVTFEREFNNFHLASTEDSQNILPNCCKFFDTSKY